MEKKLEFFGSLHQIKSLSEQALKQVVMLWESGEIRFLKADLELMNGLAKEINKNLKSIVKYNHDGFGKITNEALEDKPKVELA